MLDTPSALFYPSRMKTLRKPILTAEDQDLLDEVSVRLIGKLDRQRFDRLIVEQHYLHRCDLVGEQLRYVAEYHGEWIALFAWSAGAYNLKLREEWIGWSRKQKQRRLTLWINNSRFLILPEGHHPNLASRVMKLCLGRLSDDWLATYGHELLGVESFVDSQMFRGTCYKASGWTLLGQTQGYRRSRQDYYTEHNRPKQLWVKELRPGARTILRGRNLPVALKVIEAGQVPECQAGGEELGRMMELFDKVPDWRRIQGTYRVASLLAITVCAALCGVHRGQRDLAAFAANLTIEQMKALRLPRRGNPRRYLVPKETTFFRFLSHTDSRELEKALLAWQDKVLGPQLPDDNQVSVDGKELLSSQGNKIVSAYSVKSGRWLGSERIQEGSNEIPAAQELLRRAPIEGMLVTADAMHTHSKTARIIVQERGGDYLFTAKGNQPTVADSVRQLYNGLQHAFSPSTGHRYDSACGMQSRPNRSPVPSAVRCHVATGRLPVC
jgi:hypothetical protein